MDDSELVKIAAFKLRESAKRILTLAHKAQSSRIRSKLVATSEQLLRQEKKFISVERQE
jgi:hypothetical protein